MSTLPFRGFAPVTFQYTQRPSTPTTTSYSSLTKISNSARRPTSRRRRSVRSRGRCCSPNTERTGPANHSSYGQTRLKNCSDTLISRSRRDTERRNRPRLRSTLRSTIRTRGICWGPWGLIASPSTAPSTDHPRHRPEPRSCPGTRSRHHDRSQHCNRSLAHTRVWRQKWTATFRRGASLGDMRPARSYPCTNHPLALTGSPVLVVRCRFYGACS